jgi:hypothetical protein
MSLVRFSDPVIDTWRIMGETREFSLRNPSRRHPDANMSRWLQQSLRETGTLTRTALENRMTNGV